MFTYILLWSVRRNVQHNRINNNWAYSLFVHFFDFVQWHYTCTLTLWRHYLSWSLLCGLGDRLPNSPSSLNFETCKQFRKKCGRPHFVSKLFDTTIIILYQQTFWMETINFALKRCTYKCLQFFIVLRCRNIFHWVSTKRFNVYTNVIYTYNLKALTLRIGQVTDKQQAV